MRVSPAVSWLLVGALVAAGLSLHAGPVLAADASTEPDVTAGAGPGALLHFVEDVARALEARAQAEGAAGPVKLEASAGRSIDTTKVERTFLSRLRKRLRAGSVLSPSSEAPLSCRILLSEEGSLVWATASLEGSALPGPATVAVSAPVDRELEAALGAAFKPARTRFVLERLGAVPAGVLDAALVDVDGDGVDELTLLSIDGMRVYRAGSARLEKMGNVQPLPGARRWPRVLVGWLARLDGTRLWGVTSAGHSFVFDARTQQTEAAPPDLVPLRGTTGPTGVLAGGWRFGSPAVALPLVTTSGAVTRIPGLPARVRDLVRMRDEAWVYVDDQGRLLAHRAGEAPTTLAAERVGDRIALVDLEGDGAPELVTTASTSPGEPDHLVLRRLERGSSSSSVPFRSPLSGGSIVATAVGRLDYGARSDVVLIEEVGKEALAWRLRFAP